MKTKVITLILLITLVLIGKSEAFILTQRLGDEYIETTVEKDEIVRMLFTSKDGFRFKNWILLEGNISINVGSNDITFSMPNENVTIEAAYDTTYEITFNSNDGTGAATSMSIVAGRTEQLDKNTFTREGYRFIGWSTEEDNTVEYEDEADCTPTKDLNLYAIWQVAEVTVIFSSDGSEIGRTEVIYGETYTNLPTPTKTGYAFNGWYKENGTKVTNGTEVTEMVTHTLYAKWTGNRYIVVYDGNGNDGGSMSTSEHIYGTSSKLNANTFTKTGYTFKGWAKSESGSVAYKDKASISTLSTGDTITLYAKWVVNTYTVKYNSNGANGSMDDSSFTYGVANNLSANTFSKDSWIFQGWSTSSTNRSVEYTDGELVQNLASEGTITLYAIWKTSLAKTSAGSTVYFTRHSSGTTIKNRHLVLGTLHKLVALNGGTGRTPDDFQAIYNQIWYEDDPDGSCWCEYTGSGLSKSLPHVRLAASGDWYVCEDGSFGIEITDSNTTDYYYYPTILVSAYAGLTGGSSTGWICTSW